MNIQTVEIDRTLANGLNFARLNIVGALDSQAREIKVGVTGICWYAAKSSVPKTTTFRFCLQRMLTQPVQGIPSNSPFWEGNVATDTKPTTSEVNLIFDSDDIYVFELVVNTNIIRTEEAFSFGLTYGVPVPRDWIHISFLERPQLYIPDESKTKFISTPIRMLNMSFYFDSKTYHIIPDGNSLRSEIAGTDLNKIVARISDGMKFEPKNTYHYLSWAFTQTQNPIVIDLQLASSNKQGKADLAPRVLESLSKRVEAMEYRLSNLESNLEEMWARIQ